MGTTCAGAVERVRAHAAAAGDRFTWWMNQERAEMRNDSAWRQVFDHVAAAHTDQVVAGLFPKVVA